MCVCIYIFLYRDIYIYIYLYFCSISCDFSSFISYFVYLGLLSFLLGEPGQRFVNFVYPFKEPALGFTDFFSIVFLIFILFISSLTFISSFLLLTSGFVCFSFSNSFRWWVRFFLFLKEGLYHCKFPSKNCFC